MADGLTAVGNVLLQASDNYRRDRQQRDAEDRRRTNQLADVASDREYAADLRKEQRGNQLTDETRRIENDIKLQLIHEGLLSPADRDDPEKLRVAYEEARRLKLDVLYNDLLTQVDSAGSPLLTRADLQDGAKIDEAKQKLAMIRGKQSNFLAAQPELAQKELDRLGQQAGSVQQQLAQLEAKAAAPQPTPDAAQVARRATELATQANNGKTPSREQIASFAPQAAQEIQDRLATLWYQDKQDAQLQQQALRTQLSNLQSRQGQLSGTFRVAPTQGYQPTASLAPVTSGPRIKSQQEQADAITKFLQSFAQSSPQPAAAQSATGPLANPTSDPIIERENQRRVGAGFQANLADPYSQTLDELQATRQEIQRNRANLPVSSGIFTMAGAPSTMQGSPEGQAKELSNLLVKEQALLRQADERKRALLQLAPGAPLANPFQNTGSQSSYRPTSLAPVMQP